MADEPINITWDSEEETKSPEIIKITWDDNTKLNKEIDKMVYRDERISAIPDMSLWDRFVEKFYYEPTQKERKARSEASMESSERTGKPPHYYEPTLKEAAMSGWEHGVTGLVYRGKIPETLEPEQAKNLSLTERLVYQAAQLTGDLPFMVAGAALGAGGGPATMIGGAFALPAGLRKVYTDMYSNGQIASFSEFWERLLDASYETLKGETTGIATHSAGILGGLPAEIGAMVVVGNALEGKIPEPQDFFDAALLIGGAKLSVHAAGKLNTIFIKTGKSPKEILMDIERDPIIQKDILSGDKDIPRTYRKEQPIFTKGEEGAINLARQEQKPEPYKFESPDIEKRYQLAKEQEKQTLLDKAKELAVNIKNKITREYEYLPRNKKVAQLKFDLLKLAKQKGVASTKTLESIKAVTSDLKKDAFEIFIRKTILDDLMETSKRNERLPFGFDKDTLKLEHDRINETLKDYPDITSAIKKRQELWDDIRDQYIEAQEAIGHHVREKFQRKDYYRHVVLNQIQAKGLFGTGKRLKTPAGRSFLKERKGSLEDISTNYLKTEHDVIAQMLYDIQVAKTLKNIEGLYDISKDIRKYAKQNNIEDWRNAIPENFDLWQPREGNIFYHEEYLPAKIAENLTIEAFKEAGIEPQLFKDALVVGGKRKQLVLHKDIIETLNNLVIDKNKNAISRGHKALITKWKIWQLISPRRYFKYNIRNMTGDGEAMFVGNPSAFKQVPEAVRDLYNNFVGNGKSKNLRDWIDRGGMEANLQANEMGELNRLGMFKQLQDQKGQFTKVPVLVWQKYWKAARMSTDFREGILRYAAYLDYLKQMEKSSDGMPKNFGASMPDEIRGLTDIKDRAYWLSNDLLGAYDRVGVMGQALREHVFPFWSWKEVNARRYVQLFKNASEDGNLASAIGRQFIGKAAIKAPYKAYRIGKFMIKATAMWSLLQVYNNMLYPEEEAELPEEIRSRPHIVLGRDENGEVQHFSRIGMLGDFLEWFGLDAAPQYVNGWFQGKMTLPEIATEMAKSPVNVFAQGAEPFVKTLAEVATRQAFFPSVFDPRTIRDSTLHIMRSFGLENEFLALAKRPSRPYSESISGLFIYKSDPYRSAYFDILGKKYDFLKKKGKAGQGFWLSPRSNALYNARLSLLYQDMDSFVDYMGEYMKYGGDPNYIFESMKNMDPLNGLTKEEEGEFMSTWSKSDIDKYLKAKIYFIELQTGIDVSQMFYSNKE